MPPSMIWLPSCRSSRELRGSRPSCTASSRCCPRNQALLAPLRLLARRRTRARLVGHRWRTSSSSHTALRCACVSCRAHGARASHPCPPAMYPTGSAPGCKNHLGAADMRPRAVWPAAGSSLHAWSLLPVPVGRLQGERHVAGHLCAHTYIYTHTDARSKHAGGSWPCLRACDFLEMNPHASQKNETKQREQPFHCTAQAVQGAQVFQFLFFWCKVAPQLVLEARPCWHKIVRRS